MARGIAFLSLLVALVTAGFLMNAQLSKSPTRASAASEIDRAKQTADGVKLMQAAFAIEQFKALNGTYAASSLGHLGVKLVRADSSSYCAQTATGHLAGPGGSPAPGPC